jgi:hypothetical protein
MTASLLRRRLAWVEIAVLLLALLIFYLVTDRKDLGYAAGVVAGIGFLALTFFRPGYGLVCAMVLLFAESVVNTLNALAETAEENDLTGVPYLVQTQWFSWGVLIIFVTLLLSYLCREYAAGRKLRPLTALEWTLLLPLLAVLFYLPVSMLYENDLMEYSMDILPMCIYAGIVVLGRVFYGASPNRQARYFFLDWFIIFNILILLPLWAYNAVFQPWRSGYVGIAAIRYGTGPYDFNFFLVPLIGMILTYDERLEPGRKRFYQFAFFLSLFRVVVSMFRGAIGGTFIAIVIAAFLVEAGRRWRWVRSLLIFSAAVLIVGGILIVAVPVARTTFNVALVKRISQALSAGTGGASLQFRHLETQKALEDIRRQPILGYGPGALIDKNFDLRKDARHELYLHSAYVWFWYKLGVLGIGVLIAFLAGIYVTCIRLLRRKLYMPDRGWVIGTLAAAIAMLPVIHTNNMLIRSQGAYALMLLLFGLSMIAARYQGVPRDQLPSPEGAEA